MDCMKLSTETKQDFLKHINLIRNNDRLTSIVYNGHTIVLDNLFFKIIVYFIEIKQKNYDDIEFKTFIESIYKYTALRNPGFKDIDITEQSNYKRGNPFDDNFAIYLPCGQCYPKFDIVLGAISGIPTQYIKNFIEIARGNHETVGTTRATQLSGFWVIE